MSSNNMKHAAPHQRSIPAGTCLIEALCKELLKNPEHLSNTQIVLPTQRLQLYLSRELLAASRKDALLIPRISTWDSFIEGFLSEFSENTLVMGSSQLEIIMESVITTKIAALSKDRRIHPNQGHAHELLQFYSDLLRADAYQESKAALQTRLENQWHRSQAALAMLTERIEDVFEVLDDFQATLDSKGWTTKARQRCEAIRGFLERTSILPMLDIRAIFGVNRIIVAGLTSLPKAEQKLLKALSQIPGLEVWLDEPPPRLDVAPIINLRQAVGLPEQKAAAESWAKNVKSITASADVTHEALFALNVVHDLLTAGVPAHDIAIIVPDENRFGPTFAAAKTFFETECSKSLKTNLTINLPLASSWETSIAGTWLRLAKEAARSSDLAVVGQYLLHPVTIKKFDPPKNELDRLQQKLKDFPESAAPSSIKFQKFLNEFFSKELVHYICEAWSWSLGLERTPCNEVEQMAEKLMGMVQMADVDQSILTNREREAWRTIRESIAKTKQLDPFLKYSKNDWQKFISDVYRLCAAESLRDIGEPLSGLQILGLTEARYVPVSHAVIVGCVEGSFPHALPIDSLIDNSLRQGIGLPGWSELEALEDTTFHLLTCRIPNVYLSYSLMDGDTPQIRSRWIERLELKMDAELSDATIVEQWLGCRFADEPIAGLHERSPVEGQINKIGKLISTASASRLKSLLHCPYRYLLESRGVSPVELPEDRQQLKIGQLLHKILEMFFQQTDMGGVDPELSLHHAPKSEEAFVLWATARLEALTDCFVPKDIRLGEDFQQMLGKGWQDVATFWAKLISGGFSLTGVKTELAIGNEKSSQLDVGGQLVNIRGSIDAVHLASPFAILVDYKTSSVPPRKQISAGLEPQLPLYSALFSRGQVDQTSVSEIPLSNLAAVYFNLRDGKPSFAAVGSNVKPLLQSLGLLHKSARPDDMEEVLDAVTARWTERLETIAGSSRFSADPSNCDYCPYDGICRKDDPRFRAAIQAQARADG